MEEEIKQVYFISDKIRNDFETNQGLFTLEFHGGRKEKVRVINCQTGTDFNTYVNSHINTFTTDINQVITYDLKDIKDVY